MKTRGFLDVALMHGEFGGFRRNRKMNFEKASIANRSYLAVPSQVAFGVLLPAAALGSAPLGRGPLE